MADFFSRLAERTLGVAAVARPAMAPLFAPGPQIVTEPQEALLPHANAAANREERAGVSDRMPAPEVRHDAVANAPTVSVTTAEAPTRDVGAETAVSPAVSMPSRDVLVGIQVDRIPPMRDAEVRASTILPITLPAFKREALSQVMQETETHNPNPRVEPAGPKLVRTADAPWPVPETTLREKLPPTSGRRTNIAKEHAEAAAVQVNIGRIEVRAVFPETSAPVMAGPAPSTSLSLADYLKQRDGGTR